MSDEEPEEVSPRPTRAEGDAAKEEVSSDETSPDEARASDGDDDAPRPRKKKKKKPIEARRARKPTSDEEEGDDARIAPSPRDERPAFARSFPSDPTLDALVAAFERGEYARVRKEAPLLAKATDRPEVREAANELRRRLDPDPIAVYLLIAAAALLAFLAAWFWKHPHELPGP